MMEYLSVSFCSSVHPHHILCYGHQGPSNGEHSGMHNGIICDAAHEARHVP